MKKSKVIGNLAIALLFTVPFNTNAGGAGISKNPGGQAQNERDINKTVRQENRQEACQVKTEPDVGCKTTGQAKYKICPGGNKQRLGCI